MADLFENHGFNSGGMLHLTPREALEFCSKGAILLDVREEYLNAFKKFDVQNVIYMPLRTFDTEVLHLPADKYLIIADSAGLKSKEATKILLEKGFTNIANLAGGLVEWERDGLPLIQDKKERLSGSCMCQLKPREKKSK